MLEEIYEKALKYLNIAIKIENYTSIGKLSSQVQDLNESTKLRNEFQRLDSLSEKIPMEVYKRQEIKISSCKIIEEKDLIDLKKSDTDSVCGKDMLNILEMAAMFYYNSKYNVKIDKDQETSCYEEAAKIVLLKNKT
nr:9116_t:CDS:2 [Entrophospora candida]